MKRFVCNLGLFLGIQLLVWAGIVWIYARCRPFGRHYLATSIDKQRLLASRPSPRIIFVGGSNLAFGLDSAEIQSRLGYNPVNMGLHVNLGLNFMLNELRPSLRPGDVVVISPEYELFGEYYAGEGGVLYAALEQNPQNIRYFNWQNVKPLLDKGYVIASQIMDYDLRCFSGEVDPHDTESPNNPYRRSAFDQFGDVVVHLSLPPKIPEVPSISSQTSYRGIRLAISDLNSFSDYCKDRGVSVVYSYPVVSQPYYERNKSAIDEVATAVNQSLKFPILDSPEEMHLPLEDFYDTYYHLNRVGIEKRTTHLVERLKERGIVVTAAGKESPPH